MQDTVNMVKYLHHQVAGDKRFTPIRTTCVIKSLVPQGDIIYAIARYPDQEAIQGGYVGNEANVDEDDLVLGEILIPTDLNFTTHRMLDLKSFIGQIADVELIDGIPTVIRIAKTPTNNARIIPRLTLYASRSRSGSKKLSDPNVKKHLESIGFSDEEISIMMSEKVSEIKPEGFILAYGDIGDWWRESVEDSNKDKSIKTVDGTNIRVITNLLTTKLAQKACYHVPSIFAGW